MNNKHTVPALDKAVRLLEYLGQTEEGASQAELARELGISASTCYRIIQTLLKHDWLKKDAGNRYDLSCGILTATMRLNRRVARLEHCQPLLDELARATGLTVKLSVRQGSSQVTILRAESPRPMSISSKVGARFPIVEGSVGAALLADTTEDDIRALAEACPENIPEKHDPGTVLTRIKSIREHGYCRNAKGNRWRVDAMSAPMRDSDGRIAASLTLIGMHDDFRVDNTGTLATSLLATADRYAQLK